MTEDDAITNPKIASLAPTWRTWRGASWLFDNPGRTPGRRLEDATAAGIPEQRLYDDLAVLLDAARPAALRAAYGFCPLPRTTYHVTVCDGPNEHDLVPTHGPGVRAVRPLLATLPDSLPQVSETLSLAEPAVLLRAIETTPVTFAAHTVVIWGSVLAVSLRPADAAAQAALEQIAAARQVVAEALHEGLGLTVRGWRPHVSLGYFANLDAAEAARERLPELNQWLTVAEPAVITFRSAALYGFTDMVSFFRAVPSASG